MDNPEDPQNWVKEASAVINDVKNHVHFLEIAKPTPNSNSSIYFNVETLEKQRLCIHLCGAGFEIVGNEFNRFDKGNQVYYETPQSLLSSISPKFVESFGNELNAKLSSLIDRVQ